MSPQFHVQFDTKFETLRHSFATESQPESLWQAKCHFNEIPSLCNGQKPTNAKSPFDEWPDSVPAGVQHVPAVDFDQDYPDDDDDGGDDGNDGDDNQGPPPEHAPPPEPPPEPPPQPPLVTAPTITRSGHVSQPPKRYIEIMESKMELIWPFCIIFKALSISDRFGDQEDSDPLLAYKAKVDPNMMYLHEALKQPDRANFIKAMVKEIEDQQANGNWKIKKRSKVPQRVLVLPAVWVMRRKRRIMTGEVY
jgi:hypothetical protein